MKLRSLIILWFFIFVTACSASGAVDTQTASPSPDIPTATTVRNTILPDPTNSPTPTPSPIYTSGVSAEQEIVQVQENAHWGKGVITQAVYSPDGKRLGVVTPLGMYLYDTKTLNQLNFLPNAASWPSAAFAPDWSTLALGNGSTVRLLRQADQAEVAHFETQPGHIVRLLYSPDGKYLACLVQPPGEEVYIWNMELRQAADGKLLAAWEAGAMPEVTFTADSKAFYAWNPFRMAGLHRWQIPAGTLLDTIQEPIVESLAFSPDGQWMAQATAGEKEYILLQNTAGHSLARRLPDTNFGRGALHFTPDGSLLIALHIGEPTKVWRTKDGALLRTIPIVSGAGQFAVVSPDSQTVALPSWDGLDFYSLADGKLIKHLGSHYNRITQAALSPRGDAAAALTQGQNDQSNLVIWQVPAGKLIAQKIAVPAISLAWSPDGENVALGEWGGRIQVVRAADGKELLNWPTHTEQVQSLAYSPDGKLLASSSMTSIHIWRTQNGALARSLSVPDGWAGSLRFSKDGEHLAALTGDGSVQVWQAPANPEADWTEIGRFPSSNYGDSSMLYFTPDGQSLVIGEPAMNKPPSQVWLWKVGDQKSMQHIALPQAILTAMSLSPDGSLLACGLMDGKVQIWRAADQKLLRTLPGGLGGVASLDFSADGHLLAAAYQDGTMHLWSVR